MIKKFCDKCGKPAPDETEKVLENCATSEQRRNRDNTQLVGVAFYCGVWLYEKSDWICSSNPVDLCYHCQAELVKVVYDKLIRKATSQQP